MRPAKPADRLPLTTAPRDGTVIRLWIAGSDEPVLAHWSPQMQGWIRDGDPLRRVLHGVVAWAPKVSGSTGTVNP